VKSGSAPPKKSRRPRKFKSKFEATFAALLDKEKLPFEYEPDKLSYILNLEYTPDWKVGGIYIETKGKFDYDSRRKMLAVVTQHPDKDIRLVFMRNNKLGKGSKMTYGGWCDRHNIPWSVYPELPVRKEKLDE